MASKMKMKIWNVIGCTGAVAAMLLPAAAQTTQTATGTATSDKPMTTQQRKENQQDRIAQGIQSGQLTAGGAAGLEHKEADLNKEEQLMRAEDNGKLTAADREALTQQQNQLSQKIYEDKHNAAVQNPNPTGTVGERAENQQDRIANGVKSGQLTSAESAYLEKSESNLNHEIAADRAANGGKLTADQKAQVKKQQNELSNKIYNQKHNNNVRRKP
jgi:hypothetical protein